MNQNAGIPNMGSSLKHYAEFNGQPYGVILV
jgi:hypothetical protein